MANRGEPRVTEGWVVDDAVAAGSSVADVTVAVKDPGFSPGVSSFALCYHPPQIMTS